MAGKEISIPYSELGRLEIRCQSCGSGFVIDVSSTSLPPLGGGRDFVRQCPVCLSFFPEQILAALVLYQRFQLESRKGNLEIHFKLQAE
jgi:hypothetical protein